MNEDFLIKVLSGMPTKSALTVIGDMLTDMAEDGEIDEEKLVAKSVSLMSIFIVIQDFKKKNGRSPMSLLELQNFGMSVKNELIEEEMDIINTAVHEVIKPITDGET